MRRARPYLAVLAGAVSAALLLAVRLHPLLGLVPLVIPGAPAGLLAWATIRRGDPYDTSHRYE